MISVQAIKEYLTNFMLPYVADWSKRTYDKEFMQTYVAFTDEQLLTCITGLRLLDVYLDIMYTAEFMEKPKMVKFVIITPGFLNKSKASVKVFVSPRRRGLWG